MANTTIAALYVETNGCYFGLPDVDPWDRERDARLYVGPHPIVAHPPCERWGRYWGGSPTTWPRLKKGDDGGCFAAALSSVRQWGGVLEHPEGSHAWRAFNLNLPPKTGGWVRADALCGFDGWTCCVEQGAYGHQARKATWLYACHTDLCQIRAKSAPPQRRNVLALSSSRCLLGEQPTKIHMPVKISTRERIVQAWAHQRVLEGMHGAGRFRGVMVILTETNTVLCSNEHQPKRPGLAT